MCKEGVAVASRRAREWGSSKVGGQKGWGTMQQGPGGQAGWEPQYSATVANTAGSHAEAATAQKDSELGEIKSK